MITELYQKICIKIVPHIRISHISFAVSAKLPYLFSLENLEKTCKITDRPLISTHLHILFTLAPHTCFSGIESFPLPLLLRHFAGQVNYQTTWLRESSAYPYNTSSRTEKQPTIKEAWISWYPMAPCPL